MWIAVVGDVHGHLALMYAILGRWQRETGERIDLILQVGDLGAFPDRSRIDRATRRYAERDPEELGFADFAGLAPPTTRMDPRPPLVFIPGNHEDFEFLDERDAAASPDAVVYPVSGDGKILALRSGRVWTFESGAPASDDTRGPAADAVGGLRVAGVSGVDGRERKRHVHPRLHLQEEDALALAGRSRGAFDILISHDGPDGVWGSHRPGAGSPALRLVIEEARPALAFFGHYDLGAEWQIGRTRVFALGGCTYVPRGHWPIKRHGIVLVEWPGRLQASSDEARASAGPSEPRAERLSPNWLQMATRDSWRHWR